MDKLPDNMCGNICIIICVNVNLQLTIGDYTKVFLFMQNIDYHKGKQLVNRKLNILSDNKQTTYVTNVSSMLHLHVLVCTTVIPGTHTSTTADA